VARRRDRLQALAAEIDKAGGTAVVVEAYGIGVICWVLLGSTILNRLFSRPALPSALVPTMALELGIPSVAGSAYFAVAGRTVSFIACVLGGYTVLMALVQTSPVLTCQG
jgi:tellurite resistance protein